MIGKENKMLSRKEVLDSYRNTVEEIKEAGLFKGELPYVSPQGAYVTMQDGRRLLCMCANNYLGLGDNPRLIAAAKKTYDEKGYGVASVRFICGTQDIHKQLEAKISHFLKTDDTILYSSCFDANGGLFETLLTDADAVISDELNHASIIDGIRLCKAKRYRYKNNDMQDLESKLQEADANGARIKLIATDGVFSMDGIICNLKGICDLADKYEALVMVDDSHAVGFVGKHGRGTQEYCDVMGRVDIITGTLGKALGGVIPRVAKPTPGKTSIVLGDGALARAAGIDTRTLKRDGFRIRTAAGRIYIAGQDEKDFDLRRVVEKNGFSPLDRHAHATVFGVYEFLERFVGVRFYFPHELGVVVPRADSITVPLTDLTVEPRNLIRTIYWGEDAVWLDGDSKSKEKDRAFGLGWLRNRLGTYNIPCCHGQNGFQYTERFAKTHPEYFQMRRDGSRCLETEAEESKIDGQARQLCHSSAVWDELYEDVKAYLTGRSAESRGIRRQNNPNEFGWNGNCCEGKYVDIMAQDGMMRCFCPKCQAAYQDKPEFATDLIWGNTKRLAERLIADGVPGYVVQMSYNPYRDLPSFDLPTNVLVMVAENGPWSVGNPALMSRDCGRIEGWAKKTGGRVWLWNYPGKWGRFARPGIPASVPRAYAKFYKAVAGSIFGAFAESETDRAIYNYLNHYVFGRVMWNPDVDVDALLDEHHRLMFGAAAPEMKAFYEGLEDKWINEMVSRENKGTSFYEMPTDLVQWQKVYSPEVLKAWNGLFETGAAKLKAGSDEARRLSFIRSQFLDPLVAESEKFLADLRPETELARRKARPNTSILVNGDIDGIEHWIGSGKFDPTTSVTGGGSLMLTTVSNRVTCIQKLGLKLERDTRYRISYFMKQTDLAPNAAAIAVLSDYGADSYARTWQTHPRNAPTEGHDWIFRSYEVRTGSKPDKDAKSSFGFFLTGAGTAWFDDVRVEKIP